MLRAKYSKMAIHMVNISPDCHWVESPFELLMQPIFRPGFEKQSIKSRALQAKTKSTLNQWETDKWSFLVKSSFVPCHVQMNLWSPPFLIYITAVTVCVELWLCLNLLLFLIAIRSWVSTIRLSLSLDAKISCFFVLECLKWSLPHKVFDKLYEMSIRFFICQTTVTNGMERVNISSILTFNVLTKIGDRT